MRRFFFSSLAALLILVAQVPVFAEEFSGGGGSVYIGTGTPNSIDAVTRLATDLGITEHEGNMMMGLAGFYQGGRYRLGGALQAHGWGGFNQGQNTGQDQAAGVAALVGGLYTTYTFKHDRVLLNLGGVAGVGRCALGYDLGSDVDDRHESVTTFFLEPQMSLGVATCRWFALEFQVSTPIFILTEELVLVEGDTTYSVDGADMFGLIFCAKLTFGRIADLGG